MLRRVCDCPLYPWHHTVRFRNAPCESNDPGRGNVLHLKTYSYACLSGREALNSDSCLAGHSQADERHKQAGFLDFYMPHYVLQWMDEKYAARMRQLGMQLVRAAAEGGGGGAYEHVGRMKWEFVVTSAWEVYHNAGVACTAKASAATCAVACINYLCVVGLGCLARQAGPW